MRQGHHAVQGTRRKGPVSLKLGFASADFGYAIDLGLPAQEPVRDPAAADPFRHDPEIKREVVWSGAKLRPSAVLVDRRGPFVRSRAEGDWLLLREAIRGWRFYDHFRTDAASPARLPQIGTHTPVPGHDGRDLAAALETIGMSSCRTPASSSTACGRAGLPGRRAAQGVRRHPGRGHAGAAALGMAGPIAASGSAGAQ